MEFIPSAYSSEKYKTETTQTNKVALTGHTTVLWLSLSRDQGRCVRKTVTRCTVYRMWKEKATLLLVSFAETHLFFPRRFSPLE